MLSKLEYLQKTKGMLLTILDPEHDRLRALYTDMTDAVTIHPSLESRQERSSCVGFEGIPN